MTTATPFKFPPEHSFPPFYTLQPNQNTRHAQLTKWTRLVLSYATHHHIHRLPLSPTNPNCPKDLFANETIGRRLSEADIRAIASFLCKAGRAEMVGSGDECWVFWRTPEEWAALVESWVEDVGLRGRVVTLYEVREGETSLGTEFHGLPMEILVRALNVLVKRGKAQIFGAENSQGVKFF